MPLLVVVEGTQRGASLRLAPDRNRLGRDGEAELVVQGEGISRLHAEVVFGDDGAWVVSDLGSKNGTFLNGVRLTASFPLVHGDELRLGDTLLLFVDEELEADEARGVVALAATASLAPEVAAAAKPAKRALPRRGGPRRDLIGESEAMRRVSSIVARCAPLDTPVLVTGESGTGKELVAEALHRLGPRRAGPFLAVNCATLEPALLESDLFGHERGAFTGAVARRLGKLELARSGTIFLDELGELPLASQAKLLRAIERREFQRVGGTELLMTDARVVAATNRDLAAQVKEGRFREDLLFRLRVVEVTIPPLRERRDDIRVLADHFLAELRPRIGARARAFGADALRCLERWRFPGNVRELRNLVERCLIFAEGETIEVADLPGEVAAQAPVPASEPGQPIGTLAEAEKAHLARALAATGWNKTRAAQLLGIDRVTLYAKIERHGLAPA